MATVTQKDQPQRITRLYSIRDLKIFASMLPPGKTIRWSAGCVTKNFEVLNADGKTTNPTQFELPLGDEAMPLDQVKALFAERGVIFSFDAGP